MKWAGWAACLVALGQAAAPPTLLRAQFTSGVSLVEVYATVTDKDGRHVTGLTTADFAVEEDGRLQQIDAFAHGAFPLALAVGIDRSFSIPQARLSATVAAAKRLLESLSPDDQVMVLAVGSEIEQLAPLSASRPAALAALDRLDRWGTTPLYDAIVSAIEAVQTATGRRALILLSDGHDRYSTISATDMIAQARRRDVLVYPVATDNRPAPVLAELAAATGGRSFSTSDRRLASVLFAIGDELRHQYLLGYTPSTAPDAMPGWRSIRVRVTRPGTRVRARDGYFAP